MASCLIHRHRGLALLVRGLQRKNEFICRRSHSVPDTALSRSKHRICRSALARGAVPQRKMCNLT